MKFLLKLRFQLLTFSQMTEPANCNNIFYFEIHKIRTQKLKLSNFFYFFINKKVVVLSNTLLRELRMHQQRDSLSLKKNKR